MPDELDAIRERLAKATPGPWFWGGHVHYPGGIRLCSKTGGIPTVMDFVRSGMQGAQPVFWKRQHLEGVSPGFWPGEYQKARDIAVREARVSMICATHGIDPDGCTDCFVETTSAVPHPPVTHQGKQP